MKFIDFFAGIGGFRKGLELAGHECVGFCEWDKFATASYVSMHLITDIQRDKLSKLTLKQRQKEILKDEYRNGEWYSNDIRNVDSKNLPKSNCWCFGAPCQDFSIAGKRAGLDGDRSSLVREIFRILEEMQEKDKPEWIIYENVKGMLSSNRGLDYLSILSEMDRLGYDIQWQNMHTEWYLPQHRERIYTVGHLRGKGRAEIFPITGANGENCLLQIIPGKQGQRVYNPDGISSTISSQGGGQGAKTGLYAIKINDDFLLSGNNYNQRKVVHGNGKVSRTVVGCGHSGNEPKVAIPVLTPDRENKRQNGRRFKDNGEPMFTLTAQDRHGVGISVRETKDGFHLYRNNKKKSTIQGTHVTYKNGKIHCLNTSHIPMTIEKTKVNEKQDSGIYVEMPGGFLTYCIWYEKYQCYIAIRKLTPKECFRLQGWTDDYFEKAAFVNYDSQLYKQAGNGVTVNVVKAIGQKITETEKQNEIICNQK